MRAHSSRALALVLAVGATVTAAHAKPPIVAVFDVENDGAKHSKEVLGRLGEYLAARLASSGTFLIVPRSEMKARLAAQKTETYKSCYAESCQIEIGKELAAEKTLSTKILRVGGSCIYTSTLYDLRAATAERAATVEGGCSEKDALEAIKSLALELSKAPAAPTPAPVAAAAAPVAEPPKPTPPKVTTSVMVGRWLHFINGGFNSELSFTLDASGGAERGPIKSASGVTGTWSLEGKRLTMRWPAANAPGGAWIDLVEIGSDGATYAGGNNSTDKISGKKSSDTP